VAAIWPPARHRGLYLWGLRWWPGVFLGELAVNGELLVDETALPLGSLIGQQAARHHGHFGLESMHNRADELGGVLTISSAPRAGTLVRVEARVETEGGSDGA
jgi:hypothetical protein